MIEPFGVYVHFPFCLSRCGYCDFASTAVDAQECIPHHDYADAVLAELAVRATPYRAGSLASIYVGGGTPSLWAPDALGRVLAGIQQTFTCAPELEVTVEVNPGTASRAVFERLLGCGVNRLSIGVQSLDDSVLRLLGRRHDAAAARLAVREAREAGCTNLSVDVIFGIPGQDLGGHLAQLAELLALGPDHVSAYSLSLAPEAPLRRAGFEPAPGELCATMMEQGRALLEQAGLPQYEVSNFGAGPRRSLHNRLVWAAQPYLGLGASAHSLCWEGEVNLRTANPTLPRYLNTSQAARIERVEPALARFEMVFLGLRTVEGVDRQAYARRFGRDVLVDFGERLGPLVAGQLVVVTEQAIRPTARGIWLADGLALRLMD